MTSKYQERHACSVCAGSIWPEHDWRNCPRLHGPATTWDDVKSSRPLLCRLAIHRPHEEVSPLFTAECLRCGYQWRWSPNA